MKTFILIVIWLVMTAIMSIMTCALKVDNQKFKFMEFRLRVLFFVIAMIFSLLIGYSLG